MLSARNTDKISDFLLAVILSFSFIYALESSLNLFYDRFRMLLIIVAVFLVYSLMFYNRLTSIITAFIMGAGALVSAAFFTVSHMWGRIFLFADDYYSWLTEYIPYPVDHNSLYILVTLLFMCIAISLFIYVFAVKKFIFPVLLITGAALFGIQWVNKYTVELTPFYIFISVIIMYYFKYIHRRRFSTGENDYVNSTSLLIGLLPVCIVIFTASFLFHASDKPVEWKWMDAKVDSFLNYIDQKYNTSVYNYYSFKSNGFSINNGKLGGQVSSDNTPVLKVKTSKRVYLKGVNKDVYTGTSWLESKSDKLLPAFSYENVKNNFLDSLAVNFIASNSTTIPGYCSKIDITVKFENIKTKSIFVPLNFTSIYDGESNTTFLNELFSSGNGSLFLQPRKTKGFAYSVSSLVFDYSKSEFTDALKECGSGFLKRWESSHPEEYKTATIPLHSPDGKVVAVSLNDYEKSAEAIRKKYLQLPEGLPQRVRELADSITAKYNNDYDKAKALEKFLSGNFPYTLNARSLPRKRDFVDYFLFDQRKGYCTYFASAMAVMARCVGIPARYVEGFMLPDQTDKQGYYVVTNKNAHAWVEIYLEGFGWTTFEPTSSFVASFYSNSKTTNAEVESSASGSGIDDGMDEYKRMLEKYRLQSASVVVLPDSGVNASEKDSKNNYSIIILIAAGALAFLFIIVNLVNLVRHRVKLYSIGKQSPRESILTAYKYYLELLGLQNCPINPGETPFTYAKRIDNNFMFYNIRFRKISQAFVKARYSTMEVSEKEKKDVYDFHLELLNETKQNIGKLRFYWLKNILGKI